MLSKPDSPDTDVAGSDLTLECPIGSLICLGSGDESGSGAEKPKRLPLNVLGSVWVVDCCEADQLLGS